MEEREMKAGNEGRQTPKDGERKFYAGIRTPNYLSVCIRK